ncbi:unnamed protein product [Rhizophagus irregularis]|nr:unnamed protein product [Rhizophagus irregularis]
MLLDIVVDGDLDNNKTLREVKCVNQIFPDLKHLTYNIRKKLNASNNEDLPPTTELVKHLQIHGLTKHLCDDYSECWPEVCWMTQNPELVLPEPNLLNCTPEEQEKFSAMLGEIFQLNIGQSLYNR